MERVAKVPVWILFPGLDPYLWSEIVLSKIASKIGKPLFADPATTNKEKLSFARVLVEIDVSSEFVDTVVINTPFLGQISQKVVYEWVPFYCTGCGKMGHKIATCKWNKPSETASQSTKPVLATVPPETDPIVVEEQLNEVTQSYDADPFLDGAFTEVPGEDLQETAEISSFLNGEILEAVDIISETDLVLGATSEGVKIGMASILENVDSGCSLLGQRSPVGMPSSSDPSSELHSGCAVLDETRVKEHKASKIIKKKFSNWHVIIHFKVNHHESCSTFHLSIVYGCNDPLDRHRLWTSLVAGSTAEPWLVLGDFNVVRTPSEKLSNTPPVLQDMLDFNDCLASCNLDDLTCIRVDMTWTNKQDSGTRVWSKLDRVLANPGFISSFPNAFGHFQESGISDHSLVLVHVSYEKKVAKRFSFLNSWAGHPDYLQTVKAAWETPLQGSPMYCFFQKLKSVKHALIHFHKQHLSNISQRVQSAKDALVECQHSLVSNPYSDSLIQEERLLIAEYTKLKEHELSILSQRAKIRDIQDPDCSSKYFFAKISERTHQQVIGGIHDHHGKLHMGFSSVSAAFNQYYQDLLGHSSTTIPLDTDFISSGAVINSSDSHSLVREISPAEIRDALFSMDSNSSPGIDGFSAGMSKQANSTVISLIPKKAIPNAVTDYRPISCCTVFYKTVSKILANRLQSILPSIVGAEQAAFIKGRSIFENIMLSQTLVKGYNRAHISPRCMIKVDIRKAFDSLQWSFIANMLSGLGFPQQFIDWVLGCIQTPWGDVPSVAAVNNTLSLFAELSGLHANIEKTNMYFGGVHPDVKEAMLAATGFSDGQFLFRYLGVPLSTSRISVAMFDSLILKIKHSIQHWSSNFLTYAGKVQLINSIIFGMETFWCSCTLLPQEILQRINKLCKDFFWGIMPDGRRMMFKKWKDICLPWDAGGFNIKDLSTWNAALQCRWIYLLAHTTEGSWVSWHQSYILQHQSIWFIQSQDSFSSSLKGILAVRDRLVALAGSITTASSLIKSWYSHGKFHVTAAYSYLREIGNKVGQLQSRGFYVVNRCSLCEIALEDHAHLFFNCSFSKDVWHQLLQWMGMHRAGSCLLTELEHAKIWEYTQLEDGLGWANKYRDFLGLSRDETRAFVDGERVNLLAIAQKFGCAVDPLIPMAFRRRAFGLIMLHLYAFEWHIEVQTCYNKAKFIQIVEHMEQHRSPAWPCERLELVDPPKVPDTYEVRSFISRHRRFATGKKEPFWRQRLSANAGLHVRWALPWLRLTVVTGLSETDRTRHLTLLGLERSTHI
ncbi:uncharacterized protein LOC141617678 [Silene latifolia]|uniref:uncharacterized protein LOC141617678 n=1 Tax=Silene latifolia TaxID=37657 RepID=UPI003D76B48B